MWGLAGQFVVHSVFSLLAIFQVWRPLSRPQADSVSLRLGHGAALTCHRHVIHYRAAASLPSRGAKRCGPTTFNLPEQQIHQHAERGAEGGGQSRG